MDRPPDIFTIGHSNRPADELLRMLQAHGVQFVADIRTIPRSRHNPQFNADVLGQMLHQAGIGYRHIPQLGGLRRPRKDSPNTAWQNASFRGYADYMQTDEFSRALDELCELARERRLAILCAEAVPWRCHRSLVADAVLARGGACRHILSSSRAEPHHLTPFARIERGKVSYPGVL